MIIRFPLFEGSVKDGHTDDFRTAVKERLVPLWTQFVRKIGVRAMFCEDRDEGAPEFPLTLAISYPDIATMTQTLEAPARYQSKEVMGETVDAYFKGRIHYHVTGLNAYNE